MLLEGITGGRVKYREIKSWDSFILSWLGLMFKDLTTVSGKRHGDTQ